MPAAHSNTMYLINFINCHLRYNAISVSIQVFFGKMDFLEQSNTTLSIRRDGHISELSLKFNNALNNSAHKNLQNVS